VPFSALIDQAGKLHPLQPVNNDTKRRQKHATTCGFDTLITNTHNGVNANSKRSKRNGHPRPNGHNGWAQL